MTTSEGLAQRWQERAARYRRLSTLVRKYVVTSPLDAIALQFEKLQRENQLLHSKAAEQLCHTQVLLAEIDTLLARARGAKEVARRALYPSSAFSAEDAREESRLCREEAEATENIVRRRALAARAFDLAQWAEQIERCV